jgi:creatinine amidohydrolase
MKNRKPVSTKKTAGSLPALTSLSTTEEVRARGPRMAILPVGATEQHGGHLPLVTDSLVIDAVAQVVAQELGAYCLPVLPFSISHMHRGQIGTVWLRNETLQLVIRDIATCLRADGFKELVLLNGHGGNFVLLPIVQDLNLDFPDFLTMLYTPPDYLAGTGIFPPASWAHGDEFETSSMLYLKPELVRHDKLRDQTVEPDRELLRYLSFQKFSKLTYTGRPTQGTAEKGRRGFECMVQYTVRDIRATLAKVAKHRKPARRKSS